MKYAIKIVWTPLWEVDLNTYWIKSERGHEHWEHLKGIPMLFDDLNAAYRTINATLDWTFGNHKVYCVVEEYP